MSPSDVEEVVYNAQDDDSRDCSVCEAVGGELSEHKHLAVETRYILSDLLNWKVVQEATSLNFMCFYNDILVPTS